LNSLDVFITAHIHVNAAGIPIHTILFTPDVRLCGILLTVIGNIPLIPFLPGPRLRRADSGNAKICKISVMEWYLTLVKTRPILTAMVQFAVLGTLGDMASKWMVERRVFMPFSRLTTFLKMLEWALLAVCIKYAFVGFNGFIDALTAHGFLAELGPAARAFAISTAMNLQFGPFLVIAHRLLDNAIAGKSNWANLDKGLLSLLWFWIPAHTVTFILPRDYQIGLAALWSVALGLILGFYNGKADTPS